MVQAPLTGVTPNLGFEARERRTDSEDGGWYRGNNVKVFSGNRGMDQQWYPVSAVGGGGTEESHVYQKW